MDMDVDEGAGDSDEDLLLDDSDSDSGASDGASDSELGVPVGEIEGIHIALAAEGNIADAFVDEVEVAENGPEDDVEMGADMDPRAAAAAAANRPRDMARRRQQVRDRAARMHAPARQRGQQALRIRQHRVRVVRFFLWHVLLIWPLCLGDATLARPAICIAVIVSLQVAFLMTCQSALDHLYKALLMHESDNGAAGVANRCTKPVRIGIFVAACAVAALAVCAQLGVNLANSPSTQIVTATRWMVISWE